MFDMLEYALNHWKAVDAITKWRELGLRKFELGDHEWEVIEQLRHVLKVHTTTRQRAKQTFPLYSLDPQGHHPIFLSFNTQPCHCDPRHGSH